jgi:hypothetical protein
MVCFHFVFLERAMRFELTTLTLARLCSTPELRPHNPELENPRKPEAIAAFRARATLLRISPTNAIGEMHERACKRGL